MGRVEQRQVVFRSLVANARDFLQQSLLYLEENPKLSLLHFCTAVELFLKARLMLEHWSLIFDKPGEAELSRFTSGDFTSVNFNAALVRLRNIAQAGISPQAEQCFLNLQKHRNRLVHFTHPAYSPPASREAQEAVLAEQLRAWYYLHQLLRLRWYSEFSSVEYLISNLDTLMHKRADFLRVKFNELTEHIKQLKAEGADISLCQSCGFESSGHALQLGLYKSPFAWYVTTRSKCLRLIALLAKLKTSCPKSMKDGAVPAARTLLWQTCSQSIILSHWIPKPTVIVASTQEKRQ